MRHVFHFLLIYYLKLKTDFWYQKIEYEQFFIGLFFLNPIATKEGWIPPTFLFFKFLKNSCYYQIQIWHACKANKMPSGQHWNEDINAELEFEIRKKLFFSPD